MTAWKRTITSDRIVEGRGLAALLETVSVFP